MTRHKAATAGALAVLALGGTIAATTPASAATPGAYNGECGKGYEVFRETPVESAPYKAISTIYLAYSDKDQKWCAVNIRTKPGVRMPMEVTLDTTPTSGKPAKDAGSFKSYAGPVYKDLPARPGICMAWSGTTGIYYNSDRGLCP
ncbi:hypothetical protein ABZX85_47490 [Streptomyces sp. NPDC004539]|uniref:hypothetical protein n=1 Tax=Streptomyces sp. NPDC004539 TaxID=3154280 RepID=UPI0033AA9569